MFGGVKHGECVGEAVGVIAVNQIIMKITEEL